MSAKLFLNFEKQRGVHVIVGFQKTGLPLGFWCKFNEHLLQSSKLSWISGWFSLNGKRTSYLLRSLPRDFSHLFIPKLSNSKNRFNWLSSSSISPPISSSLVALLTELTLCILPPTPTQPLKIHPNLVSTPTKPPDSTELIIFRVTKLQYKSEPINKSISFSLSSFTNSIQWNFLNCPFINVILGLEISKRRHKALINIFSWLLVLATSKTRSINFDRVWKFPKVLIITSSTAAVQRLRNFRILSEIRACIKKNIDFNFCFVLGFSGIIPTVCNNTADVNWFRTWHVASY